MSLYKIYVYLSYAVYTLIDTHKFVKMQCVQGLDVPSKATIPVQLFQFTVNLSPKRATKAQTI